MIVVNIHEIIGGLVVLAFLVLAILNLFQAMGKSISIVRPISMIAGGLLILQYVLGFLLMGQGLRNSNLHYGFALLAIVTVGAEHMLGGKPGKGMAVFLATAASFVLVLLAYFYGMRGMGPAEAAMLVR